MTGKRQATGLAATRTRRATGMAAGVVAVIAAGLVLAACTQPPSGSLSVTPGPGATSSLVPAEDGTPAPSGDVGSPDGSAGFSGLPMTSPQHDTPSDAPAAS